MIFKVFFSIVIPIISEFINSKAKRNLDIAIPPADFLMDVAYSQRLWYIMCKGLEESFDSPS
jgi:hypothetical protein